MKGKKPNSYYVALAFNVFGVVAFLLVSWLYAVMIFKGYWGFFFQHYVYGEGAKWIVVIIYHINYYWMLSCPLILLLSTILSIRYRRRKKIALSILTQLFPLVSTYFAVILDGYLIYQL